MEKIIREIIQVMMREPSVRAVIEDELNKPPLPDNILLSSLFISADCDIYLSDYNNRKIEIEGYQAKTLYLFYLISPLGVSNKKLPEYEKILKVIYQQVCKHKLNDDYRSESVIRGLLERPGGISDATNKIRSALKKVLPDNKLLDYYMINGTRNGSRRIILPKDLITIKNDALYKIANWKR